MTLQVDGQDTRPLLPLDPFAFSGESQVSCALLGGPIRDFNLIYAPERFSARLQWLKSEQRFFSSASTVLIFSVAEQAQVEMGNSTPELLGSMISCNMVVTANCLRLLSAVSAV